MDWNELFSDLFTSAGQVLGPGQTTTNIYQLPDNSNGLDLSNPVVLIGIAFMAALILKK